MQLTRDKVWREGKAKAASRMIAAVRRLMRSAVVIAILSSCVGGCSRPDGSAFDGLLSSNRIDRIEIVDDEQGRTTVLTNDAAASLLSRLAASNRIANPIRSKSYVSGHIELRTQGQRVGYLSYFAREQVLSFSGYEFSLRDTNDISPLLR